MAVKALGLVMAIILCLSVGAPAAEAQYPNNNNSQQATAIGPRKQLATIIFSGLAGAILGLSTLSFYGRPQDKLSNIAIGFAVGIIAGTVYTTYQAATKPKTYFETMLPQTEQEQMMISQAMVMPDQDLSQLQLKWEWDF
ncbi:MAG: hypothetical protein H6624_14275 [Bdellovibrionaceae bacterium]|nr:hypothetical protein [Bdellovibrionales bacterium]MCB9085509.1 hypothetical protein [Pseudobdellovibrionaceae bacterium]